MNNIVVTGVAGFIGFHCCKKILQKGYKVIGIDNLNDYYDTNLKKARLEILLKEKKFIFKKIDIIKKNDLKGFFNELKIESN